jgi:flagellar motility protein MotE (MotC chaperone)
MRRILPLTLVAAFLVLPLKLGELSEGFPVLAEQFDREFGSHERPWAKDLKTEAEARQAENAAAGIGGGKPVALPGDAQLSASSCADPALRSAIDEQKADLAQRTRHIVEAEAVLAAAEARATAQVERLTALKKDIEALMRQRSALQNEDLKRMTTIYETMKPRDAARIFSDLETPVVIDVLDRMQERRSAPIIAELDDSKAREVTRVILQRRALPGDRVAPDRASLTN